MKSAKIGFFLVARLEGYLGKERVVIHIILFITISFYEN
jgi:hypothetical protein